jgi:general secretion pathway protein E
VEYLLHYAYSQRASDIHIEPKRDFSLIRFRIDGILHNIHRIPKAVHPAIVSRIKTLSRMDIAEKRRPQDGRIKTEHEGKEVELRISTLPKGNGMNTLRESAIKKLLKGVTTFDEVIRVLGPSY